MAGNRRGRSPAFTESEIAARMADLRTLPSKELAERWQVSVELIRKLRRDHGIDFTVRKGRLLSDEELDALCEGHDQGKSVATLAAQMKTSRYRVYEALKKRGKLGKERFYGQFVGSANQYPMRRFDYRAYLNDLIKLYARLKGMTEEAYREYIQTPPGDEEFYNNRVDLVDKQKYMTLPVKLTGGESYECNAESEDDYCEKDMLVGCDTY